MTPSPRTHGNHAWGSYPILAASHILSHAGIHVNSNILGFYQARVAIQERMVV